MNKFITFLVIITGMWVNGCTGFKVYWNVPTEKCHKYGIYVNLSTYHIIQNRNDKFQRGDQINIIYNAGKFPHFNGTKRVWKGIPQKADLLDHTATFKSQVEWRIPPNFKGYIVLDFEAYQPNFDISPQIYKKASRAWIKRKHPKWPAKMIDDMARVTFNEASQLLFQVLLDVGKVLRPQAKWGYYHYPYCQNWSLPIYCNPKQVKANKEMHWLFKESGALYPSVYIFNNGWHASTTAQLVKQRLTNALQVRGSLNTPIFSYNWFKYHDDYEEYLKPIELWSTLGVAWYLKLDGAIIWGSSNDVRSEQSCLELKNYTKTTLGPLVQFLVEFSPSQVSSVRHLFEGLTQFKPTQVN